MPIAACAHFLTYPQLFLYGVLLFALNETSSHTTLGNMYGRLSKGVMSYGHHTMGGKSRATTMF